jgi:hypothetical protein
LDFATSMRLRRKEEMEATVTSRGCMVPQGEISSKREGTTGRKERNT